MPVYVIHPQPIPILEELPEELLVSQMVNTPHRDQRHARTRIINALQHVGILPEKPRKEPVTGVLSDSSGMAPEWYAWCMAWYERAVDLSPRVRAQYVNLILAIGRWLQSASLGRLSHPTLSAPGS